jgi:hypothetical protein
MQTLIDELSQPLYASLSDAAAAVEINALDKVEVYSRFGNFRTLANLLTADEYAALKAALATAAQQSAISADMVEMLKLPGDESGSGGGLDFGAAGVRTGIDNLQAALATASGGEQAAAAIVAKVKAYAERPTSTARMNRWPEVSEWDVTIARRSIS